MTRISTRSTTAFGLALVLVLVSGLRAEAQATLDAAQRLYASADYEGALTVLDALRTTSHAREEQRNIDLYRVLCLLATGNEADAQSAIETFVVRYPLYRPSDDLPPRVRATFNDTRTRLIPTAVQTAYQEARAAFDLKDYQTAERGFAGVLALFDDPEIASLVGPTPQADLKMLADGFHELSVKSLSAASEPRASAPAPAAVSVPAAVLASKTYTIDDPDVVPPTAVDQRIPPFPGPVRSVQSGLIEVIVDRDGSVESATMLASVNPQYDRLALTAAKAWQYRPATLKGVPVRFAKRIQINLVPAD